MSTSDDSISDSSLDRSAREWSAVTGGGGGGGAGTGGGRGGVGSAIRKGAGRFILFIKCRTYQEGRHFSFQQLIGTIFLKVVHILMFINNKNMKEIRICSVIMF